MPWAQTGTTPYHAQIGLPDKGRAIKGLVVCIDWDLELLDLLNGLALDSYQPSLEVLILFLLFYGVGKLFELGDSHPDHNKGETRTAHLVHVLNPSLSQITLRSKQPFDCTIFVWKSLLCMVTSCAPIWGQDIRALGTTFNVFIFDSVWAEHRTHHFPDAKLTRVKLKFCEEKNRCSDDCVI